MYRLFSANSYFLVLEIIYLKSILNFESVPNEGGKLIFKDWKDSNQPKIHLRATDIKVAAEGELWVGSRSCRYQGKADISLYGMENGYIPKELTKDNGSTMKNTGFGWRFLWATEKSGKFCRIVRCW